ncbi:NAD(P)/FAD-dependent oxidoreductase, partial [Mycobacterium kansasii]
MINTPGFVVRPAMRLFDRVMRRAYRGYLGAILDDPATADALTPSFGMFGNRPTLNSSFPRAFNLPTVELCTTAIDRVVPQ